MGVPVPLPDGAQVHCGLLFIWRHVLPLLFFSVRCFVMAAATKAELHSLQPLWEVFGKTRILCNKAFPRPASKACLKSSDVH